jgi:hypothetical protein
VERGPVCRQINEIGDNVLDFVKLPLFANPLEHLHFNNSADGDVLLFDGPRQFVDVRTAAIVEEIDPDRGIDENHRSPPDRSSLVEIARPADFAPVFEDPELVFPPDQLPERVIDESFAGGEPRHFLSRGDQFFVKLNIRSLHAASYTPK